MVPMDPIQRWLISNCQQVLFQLQLKVFALKVQNTQNHKRICRSLSLTFFLISGDIPMFPPCLTFRCFTHLL